MSVTFDPIQSRSCTDRTSSRPYALERLSALLGISNDDLLGALRSGTRLPALLADAASLPLAVADSMLRDRRAVTIA